MVANFHILVWTCCFVSCVCVFLIFGLLCILSWFATLFYLPRMIRIEFFWAFALPFFSSSLHLQLFLSQCANLLNMRNILKRAPTKKRCSFSLHRSVAYTPVFTDRSPKNDLFALEPKQHEKAQWPIFFTCCVAVLLFHRYLSKWHRHSSKTFCFCFKQVHSCIIKRNAWTVCAKLCLRHKIVFCICSDLMLTILAAWSKKKAPIWCFLRLMCERTHLCACRTSSLPGHIRCWK